MRSDERRSTRTFFTRQSARWTDGLTVAQSFCRLLHNKVGRNPAVAQSCSGEVRNKTGESDPLRRSDGQILVLAGESGGEPAGVEVEPIMPIQGAIAPTKTGRE